MTTPAKVLVVDDTPHNVKLLADLLAVKGYAVATAVNGEEALVKVASDAPDLVLLDVMMPGLSGYDVCRRIRADAAKLAQASGTGLQIQYEALPVSELLERAVGAERARELALTGGDDYELCFSVAEKNLAALMQELPPQRWGYRRIGVLRDSPEAVVLRGTTRSFDPAVRDMIEPAIRRIAEGTCASLGATMEMRYERRYPPTVNSPAETEIQGEAELPRG